MRRRFFTATLALFMPLAACHASASEFGTICRTELLGLIYAKSPVHIVDVQEPGDFAAHNYEGSVSAFDVAALTAVTSAIGRDSAPVVVVGEKGGEAEAKAAAKLASLGVAPSRVRILEGGMAGALAASNVCDCCNAGGKSK